ncbi:peptide deformylase [Loigolactobacillus backii]|uniref:Peptide deformylase n=1 Tax=Loigolactobacillus backii TaxID=375175 RepID=A0A192H4E4_9LACO|nr:peptide deformylase [Loigolactobacillus backii]ANK59717.1 peptide deformylase [Loigolactobacillus backii]ANK63118.1 peptide deformylase [Loigolactobacillus backii]ANK64712.1 peptide deformylase [Loigolactobacillus backii]ANK66839.1 peptide deformylase [Loigolactobacillus backii]ANK69874.1 peptide deformylase [Loigolactobacillus backii]
MITMKNIIREGNDTLRSQSKDVAFPLSADNKKLAQDMMTFLENSQDQKIAEKYHLRAGVGLAAPQVDVPLNMAAVLVPGPEGEDPSFKDVIINPVIISHSVQGAALSEGEGCLSVDRDVPGYVVRHDRITLRYYDTNGEQHKIRLKNYPAIVCQHEIDHLHGTLFYDHINKQEPFSMEDDDLIIE